MLHFQMEGEGGWGEKTLCNDDRDSQQGIPWHIDVRMCVCVPLAV